MGVDIGSNHKAHDVEERHPGVFGEELLRKGKGQRRSDPANLHDGHEASAHGSADLVDGARTGDDTHGGEVDDVLDGRDLNELRISTHSLLFIRIEPPNRGYGYGSAYDKVANEDLQDLGLQTRAAGKDLLQDADEEMAQRGGDEHAVQGHLGHAMAEIMAVLANIVGDPGREEFLQGREDTRGQHLGAQRVRLQLAQVKLDSIHSLVSKDVFESSQDERSLSSPAGDVRALTARYPACVFPPVKRSPILCANSLVSWRTVLAASSWSFSWNLTDMVDGVVVVGLALV